jgi:MerR family copper efflux transcriptional regulator
VRRRGPALEVLFSAFAFQTLGNESRITKRQLKWCRIQIKMPANLSFIFRRKPLTLDLSPRCRMPGMEALNGALNIGEVARRSGVNLDTVRYYERRGLLPKPSRSASGYRKFSPDQVRRIRFIKHAQALGFTLTEIEELLALRVHPKTACLAVHVQAESKIAGIDEKISSLRGMKRALSKLTSTCRGRGVVSDCPILEALDESDDR